MFSYTVLRPIKRPTVLLCWFFGAIMDIESYQALQSVPIVIIIITVINMIQSLYIVIAMTASVSNAMEHWGVSGSGEDGVLVIVCC